MTQLALISTIMPHTNRESADRYRWALAAGALVLIALSMTGFLSAAVAAGAVFIPSMYVLYCLESKVWQSAAGSVVLRAMILPALLGILVALAIGLSTWGQQLSGVLIAAQTQPWLGDLPLVDLLVFSIVVALAAAASTNVGPILLARWPAFDDLLDGFTFGVASGLVYAAAETVTTFREVFASPELQTTDPVVWAPILVQVLLIKPVIYAASAGIAVSVFSGKGEGYDGFTPSYAAAFGLMVATLTLYWLGVRLLALWPSGPMLAVVWGLVVAAAVVVRARQTLQDGLMEKAIQDVSEHRRPKAGPISPRDCQECEMPLLPESAFCASCGVSVRATLAGLESRSGQRVAG